MSSARFVLTLRFAPVTSAAAVGKAVGGFLRYVQYRDEHELEPAHDVEGLVRYVAWRDRTGIRGHLFNEHGWAGDEDRRRLAESVVRSLPSAPDRARAGGRTARAYYQLILSPEDARGLDLQRLTRAALAQLGQDASDGLPPWVAAEHRNTAHPHVHIVMGARREVAPGQFRDLIVTKGRLARMKLAIAREMELQRGVRSLELERASRQLQRVASRGNRRENLVQVLLSEHSRARVNRGGRPRSGWSRAAARLAWRYHREAQRLAAHPRHWMSNERTRQEEREWAR